MFSTPHSSRVRHPQSRDFEPSPFVTPGRSESATRMVQESAFSTPQLWNVREDEELPFFSGCMFDLCGILCSHSYMRFTAPEPPSPPAAVHLTVEPEPPEVTGTAPSDQTPHQPRRTPEEKITFMLDALKQINWTLGDFLYHFFRLPGTRDTESENPLQLVPPRSVRHGSVLGRFLKGAMKHRVAELVGFWLDDPGGRPKPDNKEYPLKHSPSEPWKGMRHAHTALTSMAVQLCEAHLVREQRIAVRGVAGLHGSAPGARGHRQISWEDISSQTFSHAQEIFEEHQPCTFHVIKRLATPAPRKDESGDVILRKKRPPHIVSHVTSLRIFYR